MYEVAQLLGQLLSPLTLALGLWLLAGLCLAVGRRRWAAALGGIAFVGLWVASMPIVAHALSRSLESHYPALSVEATPAADAIVVLGGALAGAHPPLRPHFHLGGSANRVWHAAALYRAGKAKWVVVAAGNQPGSDGEQVEAEAIAEMLLVLGVPRAAMRLEMQSRNTRENAAYVRRIVEGLPARSILLVTSAAHMPRAIRTFSTIWTESTILVIPAVTDVGITRPGNNPAFGWFPSVSALFNVTKALKELAGMLALGII